MKTYPNSLNYRPRKKKKPVTTKKVFQTPEKKVEAPKIKPPQVTLDKNNKPIIKKEVVTKKVVQEPVERIPPTLQPRPKLKPIIQPKKEEKRNMKTLSVDQINSIIQKVRRNGVMKRAVRFGIVGLGQGGSRIAGEFEKLGYPTLAINTSEQDLNESPCTNKLAIGRGGAGKDLKVGSSAVNEHRSNIMQAYQQSFPNIDHALVCAGSSGGTGGGGIENIIDTLKDYRKPVGVITTLPLESEDTRSKRNTLAVLDKLIKLNTANKISPLIIVDNSKIEKKYPGLSTLTFWKKANEDVVKCFDLFNMLAARSSAYTSFDPADYSKVMKSGGCMIFGNISVEGAIQIDSVANAITTNIDSGLLAEGFNLVEATHAAVLMVANPDQLQSVPRVAEENAVKVVKDLLGSGTIFKGVYALKSATHFETFFMISGLGLPTQRVKNLIRSAREEKAHLEKKTVQRTVDDIMKELSDEEENQD